MSWRTISLPAWLHKDIRNLARKKKTSMVAIIREGYNRLDNEYHRIDYKRW